MCCGYLAAAAAAACMCGVTSVLFACSVQRVMALHLLEGISGCIAEKHLWPRAYLSCCIFAASDSVPAHSKTLLLAGVRWPKMSSMLHHVPPAERASARKALRFDPNGMLQDVMHLAPCMRQAVSIWDAAAFGSCSQDIDRPATVFIMKQLTSCTKSGKIQQAAVA